MDTAEDKKEDRKIERKELAARKKAPGWIAKCVAHWEALLDECDLGVDFADADIRCWRCGHMRKLQRCHIIASSLGGEDTENNIVPLCTSCHDEMPNVGDAGAVWEWIKRTKSTFYDSFHIQRGMDLAKSLGVELNRIDQKSLRYLMEWTSRHWMQNGGGPTTSPESIAWCLRNAAQRIDRKGGL